MSSLMRKVWGPALTIHEFEAIGSFVTRLKTRFVADKAIFVHHFAALDQDGAFVKILGSTEWKNGKVRHTGASLPSRGSDYSSSSSSEGVLQVYI